MTKLSSAGLVYKHFGKEIVAADMKQPIDSQAVETTWLAVYKYFMEAVDGIDNGKSHCSCSLVIGFVSKSRKWLHMHMITSGHETQGHTCLQMATFVFSASLQQHQSPT